jgi:hypothetical protein
MTAGRVCGAGIRLPLALLGLALALLNSAPPAQAIDAASPFGKLAGRWIGEGRLGMRGGQTEGVKCRVTYIAAEDSDQLRQTVRCASAAGHIEVQSLITHAGGSLSGQWSELIYNMSGGLSGTVTDRGFRVAVNGADLSAHMDVIVAGPRQIIEIQFNNSALIGLTLVLTKG